MKNSIQTTLICGLILLFSFCNKQNLTAQDPHFSQFYNAPTHTNPALLGVFNGRFRVTMNYRDQWSSIINTSPFRTIGASFEMRHAIGRSDFLSYGVSVLRDEAGTSHFQRNTGNLGFSYMKQLGGGGYSSADQYLVAGAQFGAGQHAINNDLWFSNQFDGTAVNTGINSNENINQNTDLYLDFNAGLVWYAVFDDNLSVYAGGAVHHLNAPKASFLQNGGDGLIPMKISGQVGGEVPLSRDLSILPAVIVMSQGASLSSIFGANFRYTNRDWREVAIRVGAWGNVANKLETGLTFPTMIYSAILEMGRWNVGFSYDVNAGKLVRPTNSRGAFEISASYVHPASRKEKVKCPKL